jgi:hypothetical protein
MSITMCMCVRTYESKSSILFQIIYVFQQKSFCQIRWPIFSDCKFSYNVYKFNF